LPTTMCNAHLLLLGNGSESLPNIPRYRNNTTTGHKGFQDLYYIITDPNTAGCSEDIMYRNVTKSRNCS